MTTSLRFVFAVMVVAVMFGCAGTGTGKTSAVPLELPVETGKPVLESDTGIELVYVKGGCYLMGDTFGEGGLEEKPAHEVCLGDYYLGTYEVTQAQWKKIMGNNPAHFSSCGDNCPVEMVSWHDVQEFVAKLNSVSSRSYRLPTEAEWEYAARSGGKRERYAGGDDIDPFVWFNQGSDYATHPVGSKLPNGIGIYDMSGNVWEWTSDWYSSSYYGESPRENPKGPASGERRSVRGGSFGVPPFDARVAYRNYLPPGYRGAGIGVRLLMTP